MTTPQDQSQKAEQPQKPSMWDKTKSSAAAKHGKAGFDVVWGWAEKLGTPVNKITNKIGSEAFWPTQLDKESDKAARILKSFCKDGYYVDQDKTDVKNDDPKVKKDGPKSKPKVLVKIPTKVIEKAVGLAIFSTCRTGLWVSGSGGSGVLVARKADGSWSPPSGILVHTAGVGFMAGIDIYDCVIVINTQKALEGFKKLRVTLGAEMSVVAGPLGVGGIVDSEVIARQAPIFTYMKSRGLYAGAQIDGTFIIERNDENARFYGERLPAAKILAGEVKNIPQSTRMLSEILKSAEGRKDVNESMMQELSQQPAPGDCEVERVSEPSEETKAAYGNTNPGANTVQEPLRGNPVQMSGAGEKTDNTYYPPPPGPPPTGTGEHSSISEKTGNTYYPPPPGPPPTGAAGQSSHLYYPPPPGPPPTHAANGGYTAPEGSPPGYNDDDIYSAPSGPPPKKN